MQCPNPIRKRKQRKNSRKNNSNMRSVYNAQPNKAILPYVAVAKDTPHIFTVFYVIYGTEAVTFQTFF